jgi:hypothetical protein
MQDHAKKCLLMQPIADQGCVFTGAVDYLHPMRPRIFVLPICWHKLVFFNFLYKSMRLVFIKTRFLLFSIPKNEMVNYHKEADSTRKSKTYHCKTAHLPHTVHFQWYRLWPTQRSMTTTVPWSSISSPVASSHVCFLTFRLAFGVDCNCQAEFTQLRFWRKPDMESWHMMTRMWRM